VVGLKQAALIRTFPKHDEPPIEGSLVLYQINRPTNSFRPSF
jgi:hypothetical protein